MAGIFGFGSRVLMGSGVGLMIVSLLVVPVGGLWADDGISTEVPCNNAATCDPSNLCRSRPQPCPGASNCKPVPLPAGYGCDKCQCKPAGPSTGALCECSP
jgi:hypothetical protein